MNALTNFHLRFKIKLIQYPPNKMRYHNEQHMRVYSKKAVKYIKIK